MLYSWEIKFIQEVIFHCIFCDGYDSDTSKKVNSKLVHLKYCEERGDEIKDFTFEEIQFISKWLNSCFAETLCIDESFLQGLRRKVSLIHDRVVYLSKLRPRK